MKKNESADHKRPASSPGSTRTRRERTLLSGTRSAGLRRLLRLDLVPGGEDRRFALAGEAGLQLGGPFLRKRLPPIERVLRGGLQGTGGEPLRDSPRVAH